MDKNGILYKLRRKCQVIAHDITSPEFVSKIYFKHILGYKLNLKEPKTFNEKLQWLKLYHWPKDSKAIACADKYAVREHIRSVGKEDLLNEILFAWDNPDQICWEQLPEQFVIKCNHGCRYNIICADKSKLDTKEAVKTLKKWMREDFSKFNAEPHYAKIPKKIICEKFLGGNIVNHNIYCFNGKAIFLSVAGGLGNLEDEYLTYYNADGTVADFKNRSYPVREEPLTPLLPEMIRTAEFLAKDFPMVRVDLFDVDGKIILSELTFTPGGAVIPLSPVEADARLGDMLDISKCMERAKV